MPKAPVKDYPAVFRRIWEACRAIPKGKTASYQYLAAKTGNPRASRVVAMAMARNPYAPQVPCHRVVRADGSIGGYSSQGGPNKKISMLKKEGVRFEGKKIHPASLLILK